MLKKEFRLRSKKEFKAVYNAGRVIGGNYLVIYLRANRKEKNRWGFVVSRKVGGAVIRNQIKRRLREVTKMIQNNLKTGYDIVVIARSGIRKVEFWSLLKDLEHTCRRAKVYI
ncbi:MAG: ribonuclease P protein component [Firmicutes bacterium]|nr:ribonuclease P protein component [Bacillota bacterium]